MRQSCFENSFAIRKAVKQSKNNPWLFLSIENIRGMLLTNKNYETQHRIRKISLWLQVYFFLICFPSPFSSQVIFQFFPPFKSLLFTTCPQTGREEVGNKYTNPKTYMNQIQRPLPLIVSKSVQRDQKERDEDITTSRIQVAPINTFSQ